MFRIRHAHTHTHSAKQHHPSVRSPLQSNERYSLCRLYCYARSTPNIIYAHIFPSFIFVISSALCRLHPLAYTHPHAMPSRGYGQFICVCALVLVSKQIFSRYLLSFLWCKIKSRECVCVCNWIELSLQMMRQSVVRSVVNSVCVVATHIDNNTGYCLVAIDGGVTWSFVKWLNHHLLPKCTKICHLQSN